MTTPTAKRARGRTAILVKDCIYCLPVSLRSPLQVIAVRVHLPSLCFTLCNIYLPLAIAVRRADLANVLSHLPPPFILLGDFNAQDILWGTTVAENRGTSVYYIYICRFWLNPHEHKCIYASLPGVRSQVYVGPYLSSPDVAVHFDWSGVSD
jgi:hypothetical protein